MELKSRKLTLTLYKEDDEIVEALSPLTATQRNLVVEKALLYYARHLEENTNILEPLFDAEKVNSNEVLEPLKRGHIKFSPEEEKEARRNILAEYLRGEGSKVDSKEKVNKSKMYKIEVRNEKASRMIEYAASVSERTMDLVKRALEYYIYLLKSDKSIKDFNLLHIETNNTGVVEEEYVVTELMEEESGKSYMYVYILDDLLRRTILDIVRPEDRTKVFEDAVRYYSEYIESNPEVEGYLYDINKINSDEEIDVKKRTRHIDMSEEELKGEAWHCKDAYIEGKICIADPRLKSILNEVIVRDRFSTYPPKDIEIKKYKRVNRVGIRYKITDEKQQRIMAYVYTKTTFPSLFIEKALVYYINEILKCKIEEIGEKLQLEMKVRS